ncbi:MAG: hypothetical protein WCG34_12965 [Leptolinea sp.]
MTAVPHQSSEAITDTDPFEYKLERLLCPKQANPEFVQKLKNRLLAQPRITIETRRQYKAFWVIAAGLFAGALAVFLFSQKRKMQADLE